MLDRGYKRFRISLTNNNSLLAKNQKLTHTKFYLRQFELSKSDVFCVTNKKKTERHQLQNRFQRRSIEAINNTRFKNDSFYSESLSEKKAHCLKKNKKYIPPEKQSYRERYELDLLGRKDMEQDDSFPLIKAKRFTIKKKKSFMDYENSQQKSIPSQKKSTNYGPWQNPEQTNLQINKYF